MSIPVIKPLYSQIRPINSAAAERRSHWEKFRHRHVVFLFNLDNETSETASGEREGPSGALELLDP